MTKHEAFKKWLRAQGGEKLSFIEYLTHRATEYLNEPVNFNGKTKDEEGYGWSAAQSRLTHLVHEHLHYSISTAMKQAVANANSQIATGIQQTVKIKLEEISRALQVSVKTK